MPVEDRQACSWCRSVPVGRPPSNSSDPDSMKMKRSEMLEDCASAGVAYLPPEAQPWEAELACIAVLDAAATFRKENGL